MFDKDGVLEQISDGKGYIDMSTIDADTSSKIGKVWLLISPFVRQGNEILWTKGLWVCCIMICIWWMFTGDFRERWFLSWSSCFRQQKACRRWPTSNPGCRGEGNIIYLVPFLCDCCQLYIFRCCLSRIFKIQVLLALNKCFFMYQDYDVLLTNQTIVETWEL